MKQLLFIGFGVALLAGCVTTQNKEQIQQSEPHREIEQLSWSASTLPVDKKILITPESQQWLESEYIGGVATVSLAANRGPLTISIVSALNTDMTILAPKVTIYDDNFIKVDTIPFEQFEYKMQRGLQSDRLQAQFDYLPIAGAETIHLVIGTTPDLLNQTTEVLHPAKADAIARGNHPIDIPNPIAKHTTYGQLQIEAKPLGSGIFGDSKQDTPQSTILTKEEIVTDNNAMPTPTSQSVNYYSNAIESALKSGDIDTALRLLDEAERLNIQEARRTFIETIKPPM